MFRLFLIMPIFFMGLSNSTAQLSEILRSDRPGATDAATAVGQGMGQVQMGGSYFALDHLNLDFQSTGPNISLVGRYGIIEKLEFRTSMAWRWETITIQSEEERRGGLALLNLGFRINIIDGKEEKISLGIQPDVRIQRVGPPEFQIDQPAPRLFALLNMPLFKRFLISSNLGLVWNQPDESPVGAGTLNLSTSINQNTSIFIEAFGNLYIPAEGFNMNTGVGYLLNNDLQLDLVMTYFGVTGELQGAGIDIGVSWRFGVNRKS